MSFWATQGGEFRTLSEGLKIPKLMVMKGNYHKFWRRERGNLIIQAFRYLDTWSPRAKPSCHSPDSSQESRQSLCFLLYYVLGKNFFFLPTGRVEIYLSGAGVFAHLLTQIFIQGCFPAISKGEIDTSYWWILYSTLRCFSKPSICTLPPATDNISFTCMHEGQLNFSKKLQWAFLVFFFTFGGR